MLRRNTAFYLEERVYEEKACFSNTIFWWPISLSAKLLQVSIVISCLIFICKIISTEQIMESHDNNIDSIFKDPTDRL